MNKQELIKKINEIATETPFPDTKTVDHSEVIKLIEQLDEPKPLKLKDIISRMKQLFPLSRNEWIDEILHEFGDDFGLWKYKAGLEQGKLEGEFNSRKPKDADNILQELNKPVVPQFVADWYEANKDDFETNLFRAVDLIPSDYEEGDLSEFEEWLVDNHTEPFQTLVNMHQFGYEVKKEKRYIVKVKGISAVNGCLKCDVDNSKWFFSGPEESDRYRAKHTIKELDKAGFGWVFDCTGIEIEEVEE